MFQNRIGLYMAAVTLQILTSAAVAQSCPEGFVPNRGHFNNGSDCIRQTFIQQETAGYQVGDALVGFTNNQGIGLQFHYRNSEPVNLEIYVERPGSLALRSDLSLSREVPHPAPFRGANYDPRDFVRKETPCYIDPDQDHCN